MFGAVHVAGGSATDVLLAVARDFTPRVEICGPHDVTLDLAGLTRLFGDSRAMGEALCRTAADRGLRVRVAIAGTRTAARLLASAAGGPVTVVDPGAEAAALAPLPLTRLALIVNDPNVPNDPNDPNDLLTTFHRWGLRTLGEVAALPADAVAARLGQEGVRWQRLARGEDPRPLLPAVGEERFEQALDLEWPIEGLEPLSFVLGRLMEPLAAHLERRGRGAAVLHVRLHLVTRVVHERSLQLPAPMRDARTLRTLALLDLESHPPAAAIDRVVVAVDPTPGRVVQFSLIERPLPSPEQISTLMARLTALMGEGRCGSPAAVDSWEPGAFAMTRFDPESRIANPESRITNPESQITNPESRITNPESQITNPESRITNHESQIPSPAVALRRFRFPVPARVRVEQGRPVRVATDRVALPGGGVTHRAGPWRSSGGWWAERPHKAGASHRVTEDSQKSLRVSVPPWPVDPWERDEWDVTLSDGATYRVFRDRTSDAWFIEGIVD